MNDFDAACQYHPEVAPWLDKISQASSEYELLQILVSAIKDKHLGGIGGLFYNGWAADTLGAAAEQRMELLR